MPRRHRRCSRRQHWSLLSCRVLFSQLSLVVVEDICRVDGVLIMAGYPAVILLRVRRFLCEHDDCHTCMFVEQVPGQTHRYAQRSAGLQSRPDNPKEHAK